MKLLWNTIKKHKRLAVVVATLAVILTISGAWYAFASSANPFEDYELNDGNALQVYVKQSLFKGNNLAGAAKYSTDWYLFFADDYGEFGLDLANLDNWEKSIFTKYGQHVNLNHVAYGEEDANGQVMQTREIAATELVGILLKEYAGDRRSELDDPITVYFAPVVTCTLYNMQGNVKKQEKVYSYKEFRAFAKDNGFKNECWPSSTDGAVASMYNTPLELQLSTAQLSVQFLDIDTGEEVDGFNFPVQEEYTGFVLYGESLSFPKGVEGTSDTHTYYGYQWGEGDVVKDKSPSGITVTRDIAPEEELVLTLYFKRKPAPTSPPPSPTHEAEVPSPTPTLAPEVTATPIPTSTPTPSPLPTATPKPEPEDYSIEQHGIWYFTTDKGYTIDEIASDSGNKLATYQRIGGSGGDVTSHEYTARTRKFKEGTDADGNIWYFLADDDGNAIYVHPKVYTGFNVDSPEVQYITELTFPSEITSGSKTYPVTGIGGGTGKYVKDIDDEYSSSTVTDEATCRTAYGNHYYEYYKDSTNYYTHYGKTLEYGYGVLGNGFIESEGYWQRVWNESFEDTEQYEEYKSSFYVYNTTLYSITIPDSVTTIHPHAFQYCQKLSAIYGGNNVTSIGSYAFSATIDYVSNLSEYWEEGGEEEYKFYYYNKSYSVDDWTPVMLEWEKAVPQVKYLQLAEFPDLKSVGSAAFLYRRNLYNVVLPDGVTTVGKDAFGHCRLDSITVPGMNSKIYANSEQTLGTGGLNDRTLVITLPDSKAFDYARDYMNYYILKCGHNITYEPNGGAEDARTFISDIEFLQGDYVYAYDKYAVEAGGKIYNINAVKGRALVAEMSGFELCEMESSVTGYEYDSYNGQYYETAYGVSYLRDKGGSLWRLLEDSGVKKLDIPANTEVFYYEGIPFYLGTDGYVYHVPAAQTAGKLFTYDDYENDKSYHKVSAERLFMIDGSIYIEDSTGSWYKLTETAKEDYAGNYVYDDDGNMEYTTVFDKISLPSGVTPRIYVVDESYSAYLIGTDGSLWYKPSSSWKKVNIGDIDLSGYSYKAGCLWTEDGRYVKLKISGNTKTGYTATVTECTNGGAIREAFLLWNFLYIWREDGTLDYVNAIDSTSMTEGTIASGQTFRQVQANLWRDNEKRGRMLALDTKGRIWAGGYEDEAELGITGATLMAPVIAASDRIYTEIALGEYRSYALDEQGMLYGTGYGIYHDAVLNKKVDHYTFKRIPTVTTSVCLIEGDSRYVFTGDGRVYVTNGDFDLIDLGYRFGTVLYNNMFTRTGYDFTGWNTTADGIGTGYQPGDELLLEEDLVLYAQWKRSNNVIHYDGNGGIGYMPDTILEPEVTSTYLSENKFTMAGYKFTGWNTEPDGSGTAYDEEEFVSYIFGRMTLYAQWEEITTSYTLVYMKYPYGTPENTVWKQEVLSYRQETTVEGAPYTATGYTVSYDINKPPAMSTTPAELSLTEKNTKTDPAEFDRWMLYREDGSGGHRYGGRKYQTGQTLSMLTKTDDGFVYLYPSWKEMGAYVLLPETESEGWMFYGWSEYADGSGKIYYVMDESGFGGTYTPVKNTVLYGIWEPRGYIITLDDRGATSTGHTEKVQMFFGEMGEDIIIPSKTGYIFQGYFTDIRGTGKMYYNSTGNCVKPWEEEMTSVLYAYWVQIPVELPIEEPHIVPIPVPELYEEGKIDANGAKALIYADDYNSKTGALTDLQPYLTYDTPVSEGAIPGTEQVCFRAKTGAWMLNYRFHRAAGTDYVRVYVTVPYRTQYELENEELVISAPQTKTYSVMVPKIWSYWEVVESGLFYPAEVTVKNSALIGKKLTVPVEREAESAVKNPSHSATNYGEKEEHVFWKEYDLDGVPVIRVLLEEEQYIISERQGMLPDIDHHLRVICCNTAWEDEQQAMVRSDRYVFDGEVVLSDEWMTDGKGQTLQKDKLPTKEEVPLTSYLQIYKSGVALNEYTKNGTYETEVTVTYIGEEENFGATARKTVKISNVNPLKLHTPVACKGGVADGIERTEEGLVLTLEEEKNFFTLRIDNQGVHRNCLGYGEKNFRIALSGKSNVAKNEDMYLNQVQFTFDVYADAGENVFVKAGTWFTVGEAAVRFYVPVVQENGEYEINFRTIAVNCPKDEFGEYLTEEKEQRLVNTNMACYVATDTQKIEIQSYIEDFIITDTDDPAVKKQLEAGNQALTLKKGYRVSFEILSQGAFESEEAEAEIIPTYYWVSEDGRERQKVKLCFGDVVIGKLIKSYREKEAYQKWTGSCYIPADVLCVEESFDLEKYALLQTITGEEEFFKKKGFLTISFEIRMKSDIGEWQEFSNWNHTELAEDALNSGWSYVAGDVVRYDLSKSIAEDYEVGGVE